MHLFFCYRMRESYFCGMEIEPVGRSAIETIANYGRIEPVWVRRMHTQLMGTTCLRKEIYENQSVRTALTNTIPGDRRLAVRMVYHLTRTVVRVRE